MVGNRYYYPTDYAYDVYPYEGGFSSELVGYRPGKKTADWGGDRSDTGYKKSVKKLKLMTKL